MMNLHRLPNALEGEKPVLFLRRHWVELLSIGFYSLALTAVPVLILVGLRTVGVNPLENPTLAPFAVVGGSIYLFFTLIIFLTQFTDFYLDTWIVTTERVINIEQTGLFSRIVSELHLNEIQDVTSETKGFLETFLTYGNVYIQTAATRERFNFQNVDNPDHVKEVVIRLVQEDKVRHPLNNPTTPVPQGMAAPQAR